MRTLFLSLLIVGFNQIVFANQTSTTGISSASPIDTIQIIGKNFYYKDLLIPKENLYNKIKINPESERLFRSSKNLYTTGLIMAGTGGFLLGYALASAFKVPGEEWEITAFGTSLIGGLVLCPTAFILESSSRKRLRKAVQSYNGFIQHKVSRQPNLEFNLGLTQVGLRLNF